MHNQKLVFFASCLGMLIFGVVFSTLGAILPFVIEKFAIDKINAGSLMSFLSIGMLIGSLLFGPVADRYGYKALLIICTSCIFVGLEGIAWADQFWMLRISVSLIGFGGGVINGGTNALVVDISEGERSAKLSILGIFFGVGAIGMPFLMGMLLKFISYESFIIMTGLLVLLPILFFIIIRFPVPKQEQGFPIAQGLGLIKKTTLLLLAFVLFFESGIEVSMSSWTTTFLKEELSIDPALSVALLSFYGLGMVVARLILGYTLKKVSSSLILISSFLISFVAIWVMIVSNNPYLSVPTLFLIGVGCAAVFPVILSYIGDLYPRLSGTAFSITFVIALIGGTIFPLFIGIIANTYNLRFAFIIIPFGIIIMILLFGILKKKRLNATII
jgi:MFS family permease